MQCLRSIVLFFACTGSFAVVLTSTKEKSEETESNCYTCDVGMPDVNTAGNPFAAYYDETAHLSENVKLRMVELLRNLGFGLDDIYAQLVQWTGHHHWLNLLNQGWQGVNSAFESVVGGVTSYWGNLGLLQYTSSASSQTGSAMNKSGGINLGSFTAVLWGYPIFSQYSTTPNFIRPSANPFYAVPDDKKVSFWGNMACWASARATAHQWATSGDAKHGAKAKKKAVEVYGDAGNQVWDLKDWKNKGVHKGGGFVSGNAAQKAVPDPFAKLYGGRHNEASKRLGDTIGENDITSKIFTTIKAHKPIVFALNLHERAGAPGNELKREADGEETKTIEIKHFVTVVGANNAGQVLIWDPLGSCEGVVPLADAKKAEQYLKANFCEFVPDKANCYESIWKNAQECLYAGTLQYSTGGLDVKFDGCATAEKACIVVAMYAGEKEGPGKQHVDQMQTFWER